MLKKIAIGGGVLFALAMVGCIASPPKDATVSPVPAASTIAATSTTTPTPAPTPFNFGSGSMRVGTDVAAGTYRTRAAPTTCYWARLSGFTGATGEIIANNLGAGYAVVTIAATDKGFESQGCGRWSVDLSAVKDPVAPFDQGTFMVGIDVAPGTWRSSRTDGFCYWARLSGFGGSITGEIIANHIGEGAATVEIRGTDKGFTSTNCGTWTKAG